MQTVQLSKEIRSIKVSEVEEASWNVNEMLDPEFHAEEDCYEHLAMHYIVYMVRTSYRSVWMVS
jgi:hypothetical protein